MISLQPTQISLICPLCLQCEKKITCFSLALEVKGKLVWERKDLSMTWGPQGDHSLGKEALVTNRTHLCDRPGTSLHVSSVHLWKPEDPPTHTHKKMFYLFLTRS